MAVALPTPESLGLQIPQADRPIAQFGGLEEAERERGAAMTGLGQTVQKQADFIQDVTNENTARDASVALGAKMGDALNNYMQLSGKAAHDAYPGFVDTIQKARSDAVASMPNMETQNMLGQQAAYMNDRQLLMGGRYAGDQFKQWTRQSYAGKVTAAANQAVIDRYNPDALVSHVGDVR